jgi:hypothetical protein
MNSRIIGFIFYLGVTTCIAEAEVSVKDTTHIAPTMKMDHSHTPIALPQRARKPRLSISITKDAMSGYNLTLTTENYQLGAPPLTTDMAQLMVLSTKIHDQVVSGHAHLYINGQKIQRIYGHQLHLPVKLFKHGINSISVTLNDHAHRYWTVEHKKILATIMFNTSGKQQVTTIKQNFASFPIQ